MSAPALRLPEPAKPFTLYLNKKDKVAMGVLSLILRTWDRLVTFSNQLDNVATVWLGCLQAVAAIALLVHGGIS